MIRIYGGQTSLPTYDSNIARYPYNRKSESLLNGWLTRALGQLRNQPNKKKASLNNLTRTQTIKYPQWILSIAI